ncbi:MAG: ATP-binding protein [Sphaerochaetaceae bacterium]|nr:ATP-binding protein [Sphaerochaetaceae bacterium]
MAEYLPRITDSILRNELDSVGAVLLEGPKWCGKTSTAEQCAKSILYMNDPKNVEANILRAETNPLSLLSGKTPRLIDEWQIVADKLWDTVRYEVDHRNEFGQFILTGSATPVQLGKNTHSGTGRIRKLKMRTMSLFESGDSSGSVSLKILFDSPETINGECSIKLEELAYLTCRGGWPRAVTTSRKDIALKQAENYYDAVVHQEYPESVLRRNNPQWTASLLKSYARFIGSPATTGNFFDDCIVHGGGMTSLETIDNYISFLKSLFVFEDMDSWNPNLRSRTAIRTSPVRYFTDPSIAVNALASGPGALCNDLKTFGFMFENMAIRDLRIYAQSINGEIFHYRDRNNLECDAVIVLKDGRYGLAEIKLGGSTLEEEGASGLKKLESKLNTNTMGKPSFKMVVSGVSSYAYRRPDDVYVVPIGCLGP